MASIGRDKNGRKRILFVAEDGSRKTIRLGKCSRRQAEAFKVRLEALVAGRFGGLDADTAKWVADLPDDVHAKLVAVGLQEPRRAEPEPVQLSIGAFCDEYIASRSDVKEGTRVVYHQARSSLVEFFGYDKPLVDLTEHDAEEWRRYLTREGLAEATARKRTQVAKQFLGSAVRQKLIGVNPFRALKSTAISNPDRQFFVSRETAEKVLSACPDPEWRLLFGLARYGGLRVPSEAMALRWQDVNWAESRILIHACKTERHAGKGSRWIPLFPELVSPLQECFDQAEPGSEYVIGKYRINSSTLRKQLRQIAERAGITLWEKPFQNCRSTRATELEEDFPSHVVNRWLGHSQRIAERHYLQTTEEHFKRAAQNAAQYAHASGRTEPQNGTVAQQPITGSHDETVDCDLVPVGANGHFKPERLGRELDE
jgi:integrase